MARLRTTDTAQSSGERERHDRDRGADRAALASVDRSALQREQQRDDSSLSYKEQAASKLAQFLKRTPHDSIARRERTAEGGSETVYYARLTSGREIKVASKGDHWGAKVKAYDGSGVGGGVVIDERRFVSGRAMEAARMVMQEASHQRSTVTQNRIAQQAEGDRVHSNDKREKHSPQHAPQPEPRVARPESWFIREGGRRIEVRRAVAVSEHRETPSRETPSRETSREREKITALHSKGERSSSSHPSPSGAAVSPSSCSERDLSPPAPALPPAAARPVEPPAPPTSPATAPAPIAQPAHAATKAPGVTQPPGEQPPAAAAIPATKADAAPSRTETAGVNGAAGVPGADSTQPKTDDAFRKQVEAFRQQKQPQIDAKPVPAWFNWLFGS